VRVTPLRAEPLAQPGVAVFARAPVAGYAKTRLIGRLGATGAAALQHRLTARAIGTARAAALGPVSLWCAPDRGHPAFAAFARECGVALHDQPGGDLGTRMLHAFRALTAERPLLLIGTDCPALEVRHLRACATALHDGADAVFLAAEDGGYVLVGMARPLPALFAGVAWGSAQVMQQTRRRAAGCRLAIAEPAVLWDIDGPADYDRAIADGVLPADARGDNPPAACQDAASAPDRPPPCASC